MTIQVLVTDLNGPMRPDVPIIGRAPDKTTRYLHELDQKMQAVIYCR